MNKINKQALSEALVRAVMVTFADMAFLDVVPNPDRKSLGKGEIHQIIGLPLLDPVLGNLYLFLPKDCKRAIVENIHGRPWEELSIEEIDDCLLELLNVLGGNFLENYLGRDRKYNISFPEVIFDDQEIESRSLCLELYFDAEGIPFKILVTLEAVI